MGERKYTNFLPKWARDGRDYMGEFPNIGVPDEPEPSLGDDMITKIGSREFLCVAEFVIPVDAILDIDFRPIRVHEFDVHCRIKAADQTYNLGVATAAMLSEWLAKRTK